jgi:hypothetical protein
VMGRARHDVEYLEDEVEGDIFVEEVAHGIYEDYARAAPSEGDIKGVRVGSNAEAAGVVGATGGP